MLRIRRSPIPRAVLALSVAAIGIAPPAARAGGDGAGTTAANFLSVGQGAAALSMGGASLAAPSGLDAAAWNPAALGGLGATQFTLAHASLATEASQEWAAMGGRFGAGLTRWSVNALYQSEGSFEGRDALNQPTGTFQVSDMALGLQVARPFGEGVTAGVGLKWVRESLGDASGSGIGFDAGVQLRSGPFGVGLAARNVGGSVAFADGSFDMPAVYGAGVSWAHPSNGLRLALDANAPSAYYNDVRAGAEWRWKDRVALRTGYRANLGAEAGEPLGGASFGMGLGANGFWFDYAFLAGDADAQGRHRFGMTFHPSALSALGRGGALGADASERKPAAEPAAREAAPKPVAVQRAPQPTTAPAAKPATARPAATAEAPSADASALVRGVRMESNTPEVAHRAAPGAPEALSPSRSVKVPKLIVPKPEPVAAEGVVPAAPGPAKPNAKSPATPSPTAPERRAVAVPAPVAVAPPAVAAEPEADAAVVSTRAAEVVVVPRAKSTPPGPRPASVVVQSGETLADLAKRWDTSVPKLMMDNNLVTDRPKAGTRLKLPPAGSR